MDKNDLLAFDQQILADLKPVRRLARPWKRGMLVCLLAGLAMATMAAAYGVRPDAPRLGGLVVWGLSVLEAAFGAVLVVAALREAVPGRTLPGRTAAGLVVAGVALVIASTDLTWLAHHSHVPAGAEWEYWVSCVSMPVLVGIVPLAATLALAFRAYPTRPAITGSLAGLASGLLADSAWRTRCGITDPTHVLLAHGGAVVVLTILGAVIALVCAAASRVVAVERA